MAIIQQIQQKTGCLFLVILGSLLLFVIGDMITGGGAGIFGNDGLSVGEIKGKKVKYEEFDVRLKNILAQAQQNNPGMKIDESITNQYTEQVWNKFLQERIFEPEYKKIGVRVSAEELADMTFGDHPDEQVVKAFTAQGGEFDKNRLIKFLQEDIKADETKNAQWVQFEEDLIQITVGKKYAAIIKGACYTTKLEARNQFQNTRNTLTANFVGLQYATIPDGNIKMTDEELKKELNDHKVLYKQEASRDIEFISISIEPTAEDSANTKTWAYENYETFRTYKYDSVFVNIMQSENQWDGSYKAIGSFEKVLESQLFALDSGGMIGPVYADGKYSIYKVSDTKRDTQTIYKASHIFIPLGNSAADSAAAQSKFTSVMSDLMTKKVTFETAAMTNADGSGQQGGDLGYLTKASTNVSKQFYQRGLFAAQDELFGVQDEMGYHIGKVTSPKSDKIIKVAILSQSISAGNKTIKNASDKANEFLTAARTAKDFGKTAESKGLSKRIASAIAESNIAIPGITEPKQIIRWLYNEETKEGTVSEIMMFATNYVVAKCTKVKNDGLPKLEEIRTILELAVRNRKKAEVLATKFETAKSKSKTMEQLAKNVGSIQMIIPEQLFATDNIPGIGYDLKVLGTLFGSETNKFSPVIKGENGVYIVWVTNINKPQLPTKFDEQQKSNTDQLKSGVDGGVMDALRKKAVIKDYRYKYY